jgi:hypothetical protein
MDAKKYNAGTKMLNSTIETIIMPREAARVL